MPMLSVEDEREEAVKALACSGDIRIDQDYISPPPSHIIGLSQTFRVLLVAKIAVDRSSKA